MRPAFDDHGEPDLVGQITRARPPCLDAIKPALPRDLVTIIHKAIARDPADRYQTPGDLADDLRCFVDDRPVAARRHSLPERTWRWCRRNPTDAALVATILILIGLAIGLGLWVQRQQAEQQAEAAGRKGRARQAVEAALIQAANLLHEGRWPEAKAVLMQADGWLHDAQSRDLPQRLERARADLDLVDKLEVNRMSRAGLFHDRSDLVSVAQGYATAFEEAGLIVARDEARVKIRESPIREELVAALDDWALVTPNAGLCARLLQVARLADPDPTWRDRVRDPTVWGNREALEGLARQALGVMGAVSPPQLLTTLGVLLKQAGGDPEPLLRVAQQLRPADLWFNYELGHVLRAEKPDEAIGFCRAALVIRPRSSAVHDNLGSALAAAGRIEEAIKSYHTAIDLDSKNSAPHNNLGTVYWKMGRIQEAAEAYHKAIALYPRNSAAYHNLGNILAAAGRITEAIGAYHRSIELNPDQAHWPRSHWQDSFWGKAGSPRPAPRSSSARGKLLPKKPCAPVPSRDSSFVIGSLLSAIACRPFSAGMNRPVMPACCETWRFFVSTPRSGGPQLTSLPRPSKPGPRLLMTWQLPTGTTPRVTRHLPVAIRRRTINRSPAPSRLACDVRPVTGCGPIWLRARQLESGTITARLEVRDKIRFWKGDADLVGIRDADCLNKLPPEERQECRASGRPSTR